MDLIAIEESGVGMGVTLLNATVWIDDNGLPVGVEFPVAVKV
jgi:hypothetical protein